MTFLVAQIVACIKQSNHKQRVAVHQGPETLLSCKQHIFSWCTLFLKCWGPRTRLWGVGSLYPGFPLQI